MKIRQPKDATTDWKKILPTLLQSTKENGEKAIIPSNFKSRIKHIRTHAYNCVGYDRNLYMIAVDDDDNATDKATAITTFCNQHTDSLCKISRVAVISAATGAKGYDCNKIRLVFRLGIPTSLEQMFQEFGRIRKSMNTTNSDYYIYPCVNDYVALRYVWWRNKGNPGSYEFAVRQLNEVVDLLTSRSCWAQRLELLFGG
jgi:hypothetical protein